MSQLNAVGAVLVILCPKHILAIKVPSKWCKVKKWDATLKSLLFIPMRLLFIATAHR